MEDIAKTLGISSGNISLTILGMHKVTACWFPKTLSDEHMEPEHY